MGDYKAQTILLGSPEYHESVSLSDTEPLYLMLNLPTTCSLRCRKCALGGQGRKLGPLLSSAERAGIIANASFWGIKTLVITGNGEPTENFLLMKETISVAHACAMSTIMFTTAARLDMEQARFYATHNVSVIVSLDSLNSQIYRWLTGNGDLDRVLENIRGLREVYGEYPAGSINGKNVLRLGVNVTVSRQNIGELSVIKDFCGGDMQLVVNPPMRRGRLQKDRQWSQIVEDASKLDEAYESLEAAAQEFSSTGGHSSLTDGVCGYFYRGVSVDTDGEFLTCSYAGETGGKLGSAKRAPPVAFGSVNRQVRSLFRTFTGQIGRTPSCPIRDPDFDKLVKSVDS